MESIYLFQRRCGVIPLAPTALWDKSSCYVSGGVESLLLFLRRRGVVNFVVPPSAWGCPFYYASGGSGLFLLFLRWLGVVLFVMYPGAWCLVGSMLDHHSQRGFGSIDAGSS